MGSSNCARRRNDVAITPPSTSCARYRPKRSVKHGRILALPDDVDPEQIRSDPELLAAALAVDSACEMWGCMVFEEVVDHRMLDRMVGGWIRGTWCRLRLWVEAERVQNRNPNVGEWWQWLYERIEADPDPGKAQAAHIAYRGRSKRD